MYTETFIPILLCLTLCDPAYGYADDYYIAAVLEHLPVWNGSSGFKSDAINANLDAYNRATKLAKSMGADIIVFPEYGLLSPDLGRSGFKEILEEVPDPKSGFWIPCVEKRKFADKPMLVKLSCMARENSIVVLANMGDKEPCDSENFSYCPVDGELLYNANVVFNHDGSIISKYRKEHLFMEDALNIPQITQDPTFETNFGTFASFICFDALFEHMAKTGRKKIVDNVILSTMWMGQLPLGIGVQFWQGWAMGNNATYIVSNTQIPGLGATGSGVFVGSMGPLKYTSNPDGQSKLLVSRVPMRGPTEANFPNPDATVVMMTSNGSLPYDEDKIDFNSTLPQYCAREVIGKPTDLSKDYRCFNDGMLNTTLVKLDNLQGNVTLCNNGLCCTLAYDKDKSEETYYLGVANTTYHDANNRYQWCVETCILVRCDYFNNTECRIFPTKSSTVFRTIHMKANFSSEYIYPSVVNSGLRLASLHEWKFKSQGENQSYSSELNYVNCESKSILAATLSARCFDRDPPYFP